MRMLLDEAAAAAAKGDPQRFDELVGRVLVEGQPSIGGSSHETRMDLLRVAISFFMVLGLFGIVAAAAFHQASANASQYVSLMSGLAGIALGWLFGTGAAGSLRRSTEGAVSRGNAARPRRGAARS